MTIMIESMKAYKSPSAGHHYPLSSLTIHVPLPRTLAEGTHHPEFAPDEMATVALLIDGENVAPDLVAAALGEAQRYGTLAVRRMYANPNVMSQRNWQEVLTRHQIEAVHHQRLAVGKNATDIALVVEAMDLLHQGAIRCFCLLATDSDYTPLAKRLRAAGRLVVGMGRGQVSSSLIEACNSFITLTQLGDALSPPPLVKPASALPLVPSVKPAPPPPPPTPKPTPPIPPVAATTPQSAPNDPAPLLISGWHAVQEARGEVSLSSLVVEIQRRYPNFKPEAHGYTRLASLIRKRSDLFTMKPSARHVQHLIVYLNTPSTPSLSTTETKSPTPTQPSAKKPVPSSGEKVQLVALLVRAWQQATKNDGWLNLSTFGMEIRKIAPSFSVTVYGYNKLKEVLQAHADRFELRQQHAGQWEARLRG
ncbi:MAG: NYN domain-containing protein [Candidatus Viridilinea halotolerans]|uniref:NYN domain-containing protein n=1 Tax=Candidatus Viridilinea halotolerans TaxID=2491704 RepID=A0A426TXB6_9CHLR|nr:MAG: NYN domain-containing protein [Candidatus Viridilinea halotolerans]